MVLFVCRFESLLGNLLPHDATQCRVLSKEEGEGESMAKRVRLSGSQFRKWTTNAPVVLDGDGSPSRDTTEGERRAIVELTRHAQVRGTSASAKAPGSASVVRVDITQVPMPGRPDRSQKVATITVDGGRVTDTHSVMRAELLSEHGECQVLMPNGKFMMMLRDPSVVRGTAKDSLRNAPRPEHCQCRDWGDPHPGRHHRVCEHNAKAPPEERGDYEGESVRVSEEEVKIIEKNRHLPARAAALPAMPAPTAVQSAVVTAPPAFFSPDECPNQCKKWVEYPKGSEAHHPICQHSEAWEARNKPRSVLVNLDTGEILRAATLQEIGEAEANEKRTGGRIVIVSGESYAVVTEEDARKLAEEKAPGSGLVEAPEEEEDEEEELADPDAPVEIREEVAG